MKSKNILKIFLIFFLGVEYVKCLMLKKERHELKKDLTRMHKLFGIANRWLLLEIGGDKLGDKIQKRGYKKVAIYGMGDLGVRLIEELKLNASISVLYGMDRNADRISTYLPVYRLENILEYELPDLIIVTAYCKDDSLKKSICNIAECDVINIEELING